MPSTWSSADAFAIKALAKGTANESQQKRAVDFIINRLCGTFDLSFRPDAPRVTDFAEGKRHVGLQLVKLINLPVAMIKKDTP